MGADLPDGVRGRVLALALTLAVLAAIWAGVVDPLMSTYADRADRLAQQQALAARMERLSATLPVLQRQAATPATGVVPARMMLDGASDAVAGATLQEMVQTMAASAGTALRSAEMLPTEPAGGWRRIGVRISVSADWPVLVGLLQAIDQAMPRMLVDDLQLRAALGQPPPGPPGTRPRPGLQNVDATFAVYAFRVATPPAPPGANRGAGQNGLGQSAGPVRAAASAGTP